MITVLYRSLNVQSERIIRSEAFWFDGVVNCRQMQVSMRAGQLEKARENSSRENSMSKRVR
jgi:hypothetical protein